jgi:hypothetical protein
MDAALHRTMEASCRAFRAWLLLFPVFAVDRQLQLEREARDLRVLHTRHQGGKA